MANEANITAVDLFAGCGGMSLGFEKAGVDVVAAYDNWDAAIDVYRANFEHPVFKRDLSDVSVAEEVSSFSPDIIIGGPPCQDFSQAGKRSEDGGVQSSPFDMQKSLRSARRNSSSWKTSLASEPVWPCKRFDAHSNRKDMDLAVAFLTRAFAECPKHESVISLSAA